MSEFTLELSPAAESYCRLIVDDLVRLFSISRHEAIKRVNSYWRGVSFVTGADHQLMTHETTDVWAQHVYYGKQSMWWRPGSNPQPLPLPED
jgi:hypothetical protein